MKKPIIIRFKESERTRLWRLGKEEGERQDQTSQLFYAARSAEERAALERLCAEGRDPAQVEQLQRDVRRALRSIMEDHVATSRLAVLCLEEQEIVIEAAVDKLYQNIGYAGPALLAAWQLLQEPIKLW